MKTKLILILITTVALCGCDPGSYKFAYYKYINGTDETITVTIYKGHYYCETGVFVPNPEAKPILSFTLAPKEDYTHIVPPIGGIGQTFCSPFRDISPTCLTISNGELMAVSYKLLSFSYYERTKEDSEYVHLQYTFTDKDFEEAQPIPQE